MFRFIAKRYARARYQFNQHVEAETNLINAGLALRLAKERRAHAEQLRTDADQMDARIKEMDAKLETGFWECESGHEMDDAYENVDGKVGHFCLYETGLYRTCKAPARLIKRSEMTGQEKYESDRERKDAEDLAKQKRDQAKAEEDAAAESEKAANQLRSVV